MVLLYILTLCAHVMESFGEALFIEVNARVTFT